MATLTGLMRMNLSKKVVPIENVHREAIIVALKNEFKISSKSIVLPANYNISDENKDVFPLSGISLDVLETFLGVCSNVDGGAFINSLSSAAVCETLIMPLTEKYKVSMTNLLSRVQYGGVNKASIFVCHAWEYSFPDLVTILKQNTADRTNTYFWLDLFSINHHNSQQSHQKLWLTTFPSTCRLFNRMIIVIPQRNDLLIANRLWCLWEIYHFIKFEIDYDIALPTSEKANLQIELERNCEDFVIFLKSQINFLAGEASDPNDKSAILGAISQFKRIEIFNSSIRTGFMNCLIKIFRNTILGKSTKINEVNIAAINLSKASTLIKLLKLNNQYDEAIEWQTSIVNFLTTTTQADKSETIKAMNSLSELFELKQDIDHAIKYIRECCNTSSEQFGGDHIETLQNKISLGRLLLKGNLNTEATIVLSECYDYIRLQTGTTKLIVKSIDNGDNVNTNDQIEVSPEKFPKAELSHMILQVQVGRLLGEALFAIGRCDDSLSTFESCIAYGSKNLGRAHLETLRTVTSYGTTSYQNHEYRKARKLYTMALNLHLEKCNKREEPDQEALQVINRLVLLHQERGCNQEACKLFQQCYQRRQILLGEGHRETLQSANNLAIFYARQGFHEHALRLYEECHELSELYLGQYDLDTLLYTQNLAVECRRIGELERAKRLYEKCLGQSIKIYGEQHALTIQINNNLTELLFINGKSKEDIFERYKSCYEASKTTAGESNFHTVIYKQNMTALNRMIAQEAEQRKVHEEKLKNVHSQLLKQQLKANTVEKS